MEQVEDVKVISTFQCKVIKRLDHILMNKTCLKYIVNFKTWFLMRNINKDIKIEFLSQMIKFSS